MADARLHGGDGAAGLRHQRPDQGQLGRGLLLRRGRGRGPHARDAADDRDDLPLQGRRRDGQEEGHRQAHQRHPEPRRDGRPVRRQDRHAHAATRSSSSGTATSTLRERRRRARPRLHQQPLPDRPQERPRSRGAGARGEPCARPRPRAREGRRDPLRLRAADHVGGRTHARGRATASSRRARPRRSSPMRRLPARRQALADGPPAHRGAEEGVRAPQRRRLSRAGDRHEGRPGARDRSPRTPRPTARPTSAT